jgi:hypothetical protein
MKYSKRYLINYGINSINKSLKIQTGGYESQPGLIICSSEWGDMSDHFNPNIIKINYQGATQSALITTGHTIGAYPSCTLDSALIYKKPNLSEFLTSDTGIYVNYDEVGGVKDISIMKSPGINTTSNVILDRVYNIGRTLKDVEMGQQYVKNGANTGITWGELVLDLTVQEAKTMIESNKKVFSRDSKEVHYYLIPMAGGKQMLIFDLGKSGTDSCDYILKPSERYYSYVPQSENKPSDLNEKLFASFRNLKYYFSSIDILFNDKELKSMIRETDAGNVYFRQHSFGFLSLQGDSGAGFYKPDETSISASLIGMNVQGVTIAILEPADRDVGGLVWDPTIGKLRINNWIVNEVYKCSCLHSVNRLERYLNEDIVGTDGITII